MKKKSKGKKNSIKRAYIFLIAFILISISYFSFNYDTYLDGTVIVHFIDVGQGDATLIQAPGGNVLIDGGDIHTSDELIQYLRYVGVEDITYVIATHPHSDHIGGLISVLEEFNVENIMMPRVAHTTVTFDRFISAIENNNLEIQEPVVNDTFNIGDVEFLVLAPKSNSYTSLNDYSIALKMNYGNTSFIFTGDAESISENEMVQSGNVLSAQVLHVGHHGSNTSTTEAFLKSVSPSIAVISVGEDNRYGHPHIDVINRLQDANVAIYRTDYHGDIIISTDGNNITVH